MVTVLLPKVYTVGALIKHNYEELYVPAANSILTQVIKVVLPVCKIQNMKKSKVCSYTYIHSLNAYKNYSLMTSSVLAAG